jgi:hypothetical protein
MAGRAAGPGWLTPVSGTRNVEPWLRLPPSAVRRLESKVNPDRAGRVGAPADTNPSKTSHSCYLSNLRKLMRGLADVPDMGRISQVASNGSPRLTEQRDGGRGPTRRGALAGSADPTGPIDREELEEIAERLADPVAKRVVEMIRQEGVLPELLRVTREWVYQHADELGAVRLGGGRRPRLRFRRESLVTGDGVAPARIENWPKHRERSSRGLIPIDDSA